MVGKSVRKFVLQQGGEMRLIQFGLLLAAALAAFCASARHAATGRYDPNLTSRSTANFPRTGGSPLRESLGSRELEIVRESGGIIRSPRANG